MKTNPKKKNVTKKITPNTKRTRGKSILNKKSTAPAKKKKTYFTGSKNGKATYGTKPNKNIIGSIGASKKKKKK